MAEMKSWKEALFADLPPTPPITQELIDMNVEYCQRGMGRLPVRMAMGRVYTDEEYEEKRRRAMEPLP